jgi:adenylylsulfate kinase
MIAWITGRPASGKTTLGSALVDAIVARGGRAVLVDSDEVRRAITPHPTYSADEREVVYRAIAYVARRLRLADVGVTPVVAATAHDPSLRAAARAICGAMILVHADCPLEVCEARDPKGLYRAARSGGGLLPGVHVPWIDPTDADFVVRTDRPVPDEVIGAIVAALG